MENEKTKLEQHNDLQRATRILRATTMKRMYENMTLDAIGIQYGVSRQRVHQIILSLKRSKKTALHKAI